MSGGVEAAEQALVDLFAELAVDEQRLAAARAGGASGEQIARLRTVLLIQRERIRLAARRLVAAEAE